MIEVNLIPDVKQEFIRAQRTRNTVISFSIMASIAAGVAIVIFALLLGGQGVREILADNSIKDDYATLKKNENLSNLVTIQNQLAQVSTLNNDKGINSRLFDILGGINPKDPNHVRISTVSLNPTDNSLSIEGSAANSFTATDAFKKTILNTKVVYTDKDGKEQTINLTDSVTLNNASYGTDTTGAKVLQFKLSFVYPKELFANTSTNVRIVSPTKVTDVTDSRTRVPDDLFSSSPKTGDTK
jgi:hypothetical protein